jgi:uncharacterized membrane protein
MAAYARPPRYPDPAHLQNGTAFFASTSLLAVGRGLALLRSTSEALAVLRELPIDLSPRPR